MTNTVTRKGFGIVMVRLPRSFSAVAIIGALALGGCASGATAQGMTAHGAELKTAPEEIANSVTVEDVTGGRDTNPAWNSEISNDDFKTALLDSMKSAGLLSPANAARFKMKASLLGLRQPLAGIDMTVTATVRYVVTDAKTGKVVFEDVISTPYTAHLGDAFYGPTRLRLANEGAARKNIASFIEKAGATKLQTGGGAEETASR